MSIPRARESRVFTISFPKNLAQQVEQVAREEDRNISELFREAFRSYRADRLAKKLVTIRKRVQSASQELPGPESIEGFVDEVRKRKAGRAAK
jgi:predicted transcriptional regulator